MLFSHECLEQLVDLALEALKAGLDRVHSILGTGEAGLHGAETRFYCGEPAFQRSQAVVQGVHVAAGGGDHAAQQGQVGLRQVARLFTPSRDGAVEWNRTTDPVLTKDVLCP